MSFLIRSAADQSVPDRLIAAPRSINFCPPEVRVFIFCSIALGENGFDTSVTVIELYTWSIKVLAIICNATSCHGRSQGFHFLQHCPKRERFWHKCYCYWIIHLKYHSACHHLQCYILSRTHWQDESYACWASQDVTPFPPRILQLSVTWCSFGRSGFSLRNC